MAADEKAADTCAKALADAKAAYAKAAADAMAAADAEMKQRYEYDERYLEQKFNGSNEPQGKFPEANNKGVEEFEAFSRISLTKYVDNYFASQWLKLLSELVTDPTFLQDLSDSLTTTKIAVRKSYCYCCEGAFYRCFVKFVIWIRFLVVAFALGAVATVSYREIDDDDVHYEKLKWASWILFIVFAIFQFFATLFRTCRFQKKFRPLHA